MPVDKEAAVGNFQDELAMRLKAMNNSDEKAANSNSGITPKGASVPPSLVTYKKTPKRAPQPPGVKPPIPPSIPPNQRRPHKK